MQLHFAKWHGTGNDFILVDDRQGLFPSKDLELVRELCDRHLGIGSDGLVLIQGPKEKGMEYHMEFFNPDGSRSFCGNGSRCAFAFWCRISESGGKARFTAIDGTHDAEWKDGKVRISMNFQGGVSRGIDGPDVDFLNNGSPHELVWVSGPEEVDIMVEGPERRYAERHAPGGCNVNFVRTEQGVVEMRTYERGVEAETLSCGTGVVAAALSALDRGVVSGPVVVRTRGGDLAVEAERSGDGGFGNIALIGPVKEVFTGIFDL